MVDRREVLLAVRDQLEGPLWALGREITKTLEALTKVPHFDAGDDRAIGSTVHSTLASAAAAAGIGNVGLQVVMHNVGPAYKISGQIEFDGKQRHINIEVHLAGPKGGTGKAAHQFSIDDAEEVSLFSEEEAPDTLLFFMGYHLSGARTAVDRLFIVWADNRGTEKIELRQNESGAAGADNVKPVAPQPDLRPVLVRKGKDKDAGNAGGQNKRGDAASGS